MGVSFSVMNRLISTGLLGQWEENEGVKWSQKLSSSLGREDHEGSLLTFHYFWSVNTMMPAPAQVTSRFHSLKIYCNSAMT